MNIYVINKHGRPLMPTTPRKARLLLKAGKAVIHSRTPFTIQLVHGSSGYTQPATLGIDAGYLHIGFSAVNEQAELVGGQLDLMEGMSKRITERSKYRRTRRSSLRHRAPRFDNRRRPTGWLAPSIQHKLDSHLKLINRLKAVLPIREVIVEVAAFDIQKIMDPTIEGTGYQQGEQHGFDNLRKYILHRDGYKCQNSYCKNKAKQPILQVHHIGFWKEDRSDRPGNLITLCSKCHTPANHKPRKLLHGWQPKLRGFKAETFMSTVWKRMTLEQGYESTFGYLTDATRRELELNKSHHNDAFVIAGGTNQQRCSTIELVQIRRHKRAMEQFYDAKYIDIRDGQVKTGSELFSGRRTRNKTFNGENLRQYRGKKVSKGQCRIKRYRYPYKQHDIVQFENRRYTIRGVHCKGTRVILHQTGKSVAIKTVKPIRLQGGITQAFLSTPINKDLA